MVKMTKKLEYLLATRLPKVGRASVLSSFISAQSQRAVISADSGLFHALISGFDQDQQISRDFQISHSDFRSIGVTGGTL